MLSTLSKLASVLYLTSAFLVVDTIADPVQLNRRQTNNASAMYQTAKGGGVASESAICSGIGTSMFAQGGNAADAMVATQFCIGVIGMYHSGIGGGGFMTVRASNGSYQFIDFRETAPAAAFQDMYNNNTQASIFGGLASGVPGELRGMYYLHSNYGKLPWKYVVQPAINIARYGFPVTNDLVNYMASANASANIPNFLVVDPSWAIDFAPNGTLVGLGDTITRKRYANTLEAIQQYGPDAFYTGAIAKATISYIQANNGTMTLQDLQNYTVAVRTPLNITYHNYKITSGSAPSSGPVVLAVLKTVEGYGNFFTPANINLSTHWMDEGMRYAYGQRAYLGDPSFVPNMTRYQNEMISAQTAALIRSRISNTTTFNVSAYDPSGLQSLETPGTSQISVADASGMAISLTTTINLLFGSQLCVPETGVILNNEMNDFSIPGSSNAFGYVPSPANYIRPGKRPLSSISPSIVEFLNNGTLYFVIGSAGGSRIITANIQNIINVLDRNLTAPQALAQPRLHDQLIPNQVYFEYAYNNQTVAFMKSVGSNVTWVAPGLSTAQGVLRTPNGTFVGAGEPRQLNSGGFAWP